MWPFQTLVLSLPMSCFIHRQTILYIIRFLPSGLVPPLLIAWHKPSQAERTWVLVLAVLLPGTGSSRYFPGSVPPCKCGPKCHLFREAWASISSISYNLCDGEAKKKVRRETRNVCPKPLNSALPSPMYNQWGSPYLEMWVIRIPPNLVLISV